jgi:hypothetical protein
METIHVTTGEAILYATLINAGIGIVLGLIPLLFGYFNKRFKLGVLGFIAAIIGGAILGVFLSIPAAVIFTWLVVRKSKAETGSASSAVDDEAN